jgi:hypothetical protein
MSRKMKSLYVLIFFSAFSSSILYAQSIKIERRILATDTVSTGGVKVPVSTDDAEQENNEMDALFDDDIDAGEDDINSHNKTIPLIVSANKGGKSNDGRKNRDLSIELQASQIQAHGETLATPVKSSDSYYQTKNGRKVIRPSPGVWNELHVYKTGSKASKSNTLKACKSNTSKHEGAKKKRRR